MESKDMDIYERGIHVESDLGKLESGELEGGMR